LLQSFVSLEFYHIDWSGIKVVSKRLISAMLMVEHRNYSTL